MRRYPKPLSLEDLDGAARLLARLPVAGDALPARAWASVNLWRALSAVAAALAYGGAGDGDDPSQGAIRFHHGRAAPDWAPTMEPPRRISSWTFPWYWDDGPQIGSPRSFLRGLSSLKTGIARRGVTRAAGLKFTLMSGRIVWVGRSSMGCTIVPSC
jgi:hypothetical protein